MEETENKEIEDDNDNLVEVVNEEVKDEENTNLPKDNGYPSSTNKLTAFIYGIIFISILIGVYFYVTQNKDILNKLTGNTENQSGEVVSLTGSDNNNISSGDIEKDNINIESTENNNIIDDSSGGQKDTTNSSGTGASSGTGGKSEEVIIKDFEKELDSLFNVIDENAK